MSGELSKPPANWIVGLTVLAVFIVISILSSLEEAFASAMTFGVFAAVIQTKWSSRNDWRLWSVISVFLIAHVLALCLIHFPRPEIALAFVPVAMIDGFVMWGLINWIERRFPLSRDPGTSKW